MRPTKTMRIDGCKVVDAATSVDFEIPSREAKLGNPKDPGDCAAARAAIKSCNATEARIHLTRAFLKRGKVWYRYRTGAALRTEMVALDRGGTFEPGKYRLNALTKCDRFGGRPNRPTGPKKTKKSPIAKRHIVGGVRAIATYDK